MSGDSKELLALADEFEAGTAKALATGYEEYGPQFQRKRKLVVDALRYAALSTASPAALSSPVTTEQLDKLQFGRALHVRPSSDVTEGASETDALARENHWRKLEGRDPATPKPEPDAMREATIPFAALGGKQEGRAAFWDLPADTVVYNDQMGNAISAGDIRNLRRVLSAPIPPPDAALKSSIKVLRRLFKAISAKGIEVKYYSSLEPDGGAQWKEFVASMDEAKQFIKEQNK